MSGIVNSTGAKSGVIGTTVGTPSSGLVYLTSSRTTTDQGADGVELQSFKSTDYLYYMIVGCMKPVSTSASVLMHLMEGSSVQTASHYFYHFGGYIGQTATKGAANSTDEWRMASTTDSDLGYSFEVILRLQDASSVVACTSMHGHGGGFFNVDTQGQTCFSGWYDASNPDVDGCAFRYASSDRVDSHNIVVYGMKGS